MGIGKNAEPGLDCLLFDHVHFEAVGESDKLDSNLVK